MHDLGTDQVRTGDHDKVEQTLLEEDLNDKTGRTIALAHDECLAKCHGGNDRIEGQRRNEEACNIMLCVNWSDQGWFAPRRCA